MISFIVFILMHYNILFMFDNNGNQVKLSLAQVFTYSKKQLLLSYPHLTFWKSILNYGVLLSAFHVKNKVGKGASWISVRLLRKTTCSWSGNRFFNSFLSPWKLVQKQFEHFSAFSVAYYLLPWFFMYCKTEKMSPNESSFQYLLSTNI